MHPFIETISVAGGIAGAVAGLIIVLVLFFRTVDWVFGDRKPDAIAVRGVLKKSTFATVHVVGREPFERVRLLGFTSPQAMKTRLPFELGAMVVLEDESKTRFLVRAMDIRIIIVPSEEKAPMAG